MALQSFVLCVGYLSGWSKLNLEMMLDVAQDWAGRCAELQGAWNICWLGISEHCLGTCCVQAGCVSGLGIRWG